MTDEIYEFLNKIKEENNEFESVFPSNFADPSYRPTKEEWESFDEEHKEYLIADVVGDINSADIDMYIAYKNNNIHECESIKEYISQLESKRDYLFELSRGT